MNNKNFKALEKDELALLGNMITEMLDVYVEDNFKNAEKVTKQQYLVEDFQKAYFTKMTVDQIQKCLQVAKSKYGRTKCSMVYNCRPVCVQYIVEVEKRAFAKIRTTSRNFLNELREMSIGLN